MPIFSYPIPVFGILLSTGTFPHLGLMYLDPTEIQKEWGTARPRNRLLTAIYAAQPALLVFALESTNLPLIPKSHSFTFPLSSSRIFEGLTSEIKHTHLVMLGIHLQYSLSLDE